MDQIFERLRRRKLAQWTLAYVTAAYASIQVFDIVALRFEWPQYSMRLIIIALSVGLLLALVLAWYHGERGAQRASRTELLILAVLLVGGGVVLWRVAATGRAATAETAAVAPAHGTTSEQSISDNSIAVLPFVDMSQLKDQEYFADGMAEEVLDLLAKTPGLAVMARTSSFYFKGRQATIAEIASALKVAHVLEGSVRKSGNTIRVTTQLIRARDGVHLWSETYDRDLQDVFEVQDDIARAVVDKLKINLLGSRPAESARTANVEAYNLYLQGRYLAVAETRPALDNAIEAFRRSLALDGAYAPAWAALGFAYFRQGANGYVAMGEGLERAIAAGRKANQFDPMLGDGYVPIALAQICNYDWPGAKVTLDKALHLDPSSHLARLPLPYLVQFKGNADEALELFRQAIEHDPLNLLTRRNFGRALYYRGRLDEAQTVLRKVIELNTSFPGAHYELGHTLLAKGDVDAAAAEFDAEQSERWRPYGLLLGYHARKQTGQLEAALAERASDSAGAGFQLAEVYAVIGRRDEAFVWLDKAAQNRDPRAPWIRGDPMLKGLVDDPRFALVLGRMNLTR